MRVFVQKLHISEFQDWKKNANSPDSWAFSFFSNFKKRYPDKGYPDNHPMDYLIVLTPLLYVVGYYYGDETSLEAATEFSHMMNTIQSSTHFYKFCVVICDNDQHPTNLPVENLWKNQNISEPYKIIGYYLRQNPDNFISVA